MSFVEYSGKFVRTKVFEDGSIQVFIKSIVVRNDVDLKEYREAAHKLGRYISEMVPDAVERASNIVLSLP